MLYENDLSAFYFISLKQYDQRKCVLKLPAFSVKMLKTAENTPHLKKNRGRKEGGKVKKY